MPIRLLNAILLIAALIGGLLAYRASTKRQQWLTERRRLEEKVGSMPIDDPSKVHVRALETGDELHFAWRVYFPAGFNDKWECNGGSSWSSIASASAREFIARVRLREDERGRLDVFIKNDGGIRLGPGDEQVADLLRDRWDEVGVEQLGSDGVVVVDANEVATLLRLTLPDDLKREADEKLGKHVAQRLQKALLYVRFGSVQAFQQTAAGSGDGR